MARPRIAIGQWGRINVKRQANGSFRASTRYRDTDGVTRPVQAFGPSGAAAERRLKAALHDRGTPTVNEITSATTLSDLAWAWLDEIVTIGELSTQTIEQYRDEVEKTITAPHSGIGGLLIREATTSRIDRFLKGISAKHPAKARRNKVVLTGMFGLAVRHDALDTNPVREVARIKGTGKNVRALTTHELQALRRRVHMWQNGEPLDGQPAHRGRPRAQDMLDLTDVWLGTGARIGEILALRLQDINLTADPAEVTISGTVVRFKGRAADGGGLVRQDHPKSESSYRVVKIPAFTRDMLLRRIVDADRTPDDLVFPSSTGTLRDPHNVRRQWRDARGDKFDWVTPHSFRRTVATLIDRETDADAAAVQLGHSGSAVTKRHYIEKAIDTPDLTAVLNQLGG